LTKLNNDEIPSVKAVKWSNSLHTHRCIVTELELGLLQDYSSCWLKMLVTKWRR